MSGRIEQIVKQRGHWRKVMEFHDGTDPFLFHECALCRFRITSTSSDRRLDRANEEIQRVLREIEGHDRDVHPDKFETMSFVEFVDVIDMRATDINFRFGLDAFKWPDRCWGKITHAGRKSLRERGEVSQ